jgi:hypothetical protein
MALELIIDNPNISEKAHDLAVKISEMKIIEVFDEQTEKSASDQLKVRAIYEKEFNDLIDPVKKELKRPGSEFDAMLRPVYQMFKDVKEAQSQTLGKYQVEKTIQAAKTGFSTSKSKLVPEAVIIDIAVFIEANVSAGRVDELTEIFPRWNETALRKYCERHKIDGEKAGYPGLEVCMVPEVKTR